jgi:hypothetical protein
MRTGPHGGGVSEKIIYYSAGLTSGIPAVILRTVEKLRSSIGVPQNLKKARLNIKCATE